MADLAFPLVSFPEEAGPGCDPAPCGRGLPAVGSGDGGGCCGRHLGFRGSGGGRRVPRRGVALPSSSPPPPAPLGGSGSSHRGGGGTAVAPTAMAATTANPGEETEDWGSSRGGGADGVGS